MVNVKGDKMKIHSKLSKQPRKQRKYWIYDAPLHRLRKQIVAMLTKEAQTKYGVKRMPIRQGDTVVIIKGSFKGIVGKVIEVDVKRLRIYIDKVTRKRSDGRVVHVPIRPWNVRIVDLDLKDPKRKEILERKRKIAAPSEVELEEKIETPERLEGEVGEEEIKEETQEKSSEASEEK